MGRTRRRSFHAGSQDARGCSCRDERLTRFGLPCCTSVSVKRGKSAFERFGPTSPSSEAISTLAESLYHLAGECATLDRSDVEVWQRKRVESRAGSQKKHEAQPVPSHSRLLKRSRLFPLAPRTNPRMSVQPPSPSWVSAPRPAGSSHSSKC